MPAWPSGSSARASRSPPTSLRKARRSSAPGARICARMATTYGSAAMSSRLSAASYACSDSILRRTTPAVGGDVECNSIGVVELDLVGPAVFLRITHPVLGAGRFNGFLCSLNLIYKDADVVHDDEIAAARARGFLGLVMEQRDVDRAIAQIHAARIFPIGLADLAHAEGAHVELGRLVGVGDRDGNVTQLGHAFTSCIAWGRRAAS